MRYRSQEPLTYHSLARLQPGQLVTAPLKSTDSLGLILKEVPKPDFKTTVISYAFSLPSLPPQLLALMEWMRSYYPGPISSHAQLYLPRALTERTAKIAQQEDSKAIPPSRPEIVLTKEQRAALEHIKKPGTYVLHGETGSGKTHVYVELAKKAHATGKSSIILTPEIGLTPQLADVFREHFGDTAVVVLHSQLTDAARRKVWLRILSAQQPLIVIGPRSSLFVPLARVGFIAVDESHEFTYKQEQSPYYHTVRAAAKLGEIQEACVVLGSATPGITDYYIAERLQRPIIRMAQSARQTTSAKATVSIIDMRDRAELSRDPYLSTSLLKAMHETLAAEQQILIFINRRGSARIVLCSACGWQAICPTCDLPLTYHHDKHELRCHVCNFVQVSPTSCPKCSNVDIVFKSVGTKLITERIQNLFPAAHVKRFDTDNESGERLSELFHEVQAGTIDILIGTQLLAKGLDLPKLGLVGVINADASLYIPDYTASERSYQLLHQVIGRVGRGHQTGKAILQTYTPENETLRAAASQSWQTFYEQELQERKAFNFPPFVYLMKLSCARATRASAENTAQKAAELLRSSGLAIMVEGPAPAFHEKLHGKFHWQIIVKTKDRQALLAAQALLPKDWQYDIDPVNLL